MTGIPLECEVSNIPRRERQGKVSAFTLHKSKSHSDQVTMVTKHVSHLVSAGCWSLAAARQPFL